MSEWTRRLGPRTRLGLLSSISNNQALVAGLGAAATYMVLSSWTSAFAFPTGVVVAIMFAAVVLVNRHGLPMADWTLKALAFHTGRKEWHARQVGQDAEQLPRELRGAQIVPVRDRAGLVGMLRDERALIACAKLELHSLGLRSDEEQARRLNSFEKVLDGLAHVNNDPEYRIQLLSLHVPRRSTATREQVAASIVADRQDTRQAQSMLQVVDQTHAASHDDEYYVAIRMSAPPRDSARVAARLIEQTRSLMERLERAEIAVRTDRRLLEPRELARLIKDQYDPFYREVRDELEKASGMRGTDPALAWPDWRKTWVDRYATDNALHATLWMRGWPPTDVEPGWLKPLTLRCEVPALSVSTVLATEDKGTAKHRMRRKGSRSTSLSMVKRQHGQQERLEHSERDEYLERNQREMQSGSSPWCWEMYATVSVARSESERDDLAEAVRKAESACTEVGLTPVLLRYSLPEAFTFTLPMGRGLAPENARL